MTVAHHPLTTVGTYLMAPAELNARLGADPQAWTEFGRHWDQLADDTYAAELGTKRLRRYGHYLFTPGDGHIEPMTHDAFVQPEDSNPLYVGRERHFEPLTDAFAAEPLLRDYLSLLAEFAVLLDDAARWSVKVTPFRVLASADDTGKPTPEGLHRDGVTLVTSLLIGRDNAEGGESSVYDMAGAHLLSVILDEPGTLLLGDDRRSLHGVSPIHPLDPSRPARRDVLVVTFAPSSPSGRRRRR
ncbi:2OG-Fe dioxygenase family protein [Mycobacterium sp. IDR2000157661]|uniref:2OG-Fe dioxygenase family protein n=1 Tax=Mycobacterium sp. IDR2000157661 TaxID=2867005 RepID=UPI001EECDC20|nr:2OG-Fe dioxygenase family protein [Mycobacterium sp. IDR2000157661]ULE32339.1 2OG-Fe dioxygenase family protein [Mycobacterium sp. IDR2000157661]